MKKVKALVALVLAVCLVLPVFCLSAFAASGTWISAWATSTVNSSISAAGLSVQDLIPSRSTLRTELTVSTGGTALRFRFSNEFGKASITINQASVAKTDSTGTARIIADSAKAITFDGEQAVTIAPGETVVSDNVNYKTEALDKLSISMFFENMTYMTSSGLSNGRTYLSMGSALLRTPSRVSSARLATATEVNIGSGAITYHTSPFLSRIDTYSSQSDACTAVFIGDSTLVNDAALYYATRLVNSGKKNVGIINQAVIGNKLLSDGSGLIGNLYGEAMLTRFSRDVLEVPGVKYCFVKIGLNDILHQHTKSMKDTVLKASTADIINGYKQLITLAHKKGIKIYFFSKSPWNGYERSFLGQTGDLTWNPEAQAMCDELDKWIKSENGSDGFIDCSPLASPADRTKLCPSFTPDGAHLTQNGAIALADLIPLEYVGGNTKTAATVADIMGIDPYVEKRKIQSNLNKTPPKQSNTEKPTSPQAPASTEPSTQPSTQPVTEAPTTQALTVPAIESTEPVTVAVDASAISPSELSTNVPYSGVYSDGAYDKEPINYNVNDIGTEKLGTDKPVFFLLLMFTAIVAAGTVIILTVFRKKENAVMR